MCKIQVLRYLTLPHNQVNTRSCINMSLYILSNMPGCKELSKYIFFVSRNSITMIILHLCNMCHYWMDHPHPNSAVWPNSNPGLSVNTVPCSYWTHTMCKIRVLRYLTLPHNQVSTRSCINMRLYILSNMPGCNITCQNIFFVSRNNITMIQWRSVLWGKGGSASLHYWKNKWSDNNVLILKLSE